MLIKQIIEFELKRPGSPYSRTCTPKRGYFHDKTKIFKANTRVIIICCQKYCMKQCTLLLLPLGPSHLQNLTPKFKILNLFWT